MDEDLIGILVVFMFVGASIVNLVKLFTAALADQIGLAIVHAVGLLGPMAMITVWV